MFGVPKSEGTGWERPGLFELSGDARIGGFDGFRERHQFLLDPGDARGIGLEVAFVLQIAPQQADFLHELDQQSAGVLWKAGRHVLIFSRIIPAMWTKQMGGPRKKAPKTIAVIDP